MTVRRFGLDHLAALLIAAIATWCVCRWGPAPLAPRVITLRYDSVRTAHQQFDAGVRQADSLGAIIRDSLQRDLNAARQRPTLHAGGIRTVLQQIIAPDTAAARLLKEAGDSVDALESRLQRDSMALAMERLTTDSLIAHERRENARLLLTVAQVQSQRDEAREDARSQAMGRVKAEAKANRRLFVGGCGGPSTPSYQGIGLTAGVCYRVF